jgi:hypothetical protein
MRHKSGSDTLRRPDWTQLNTYEKVGLMTMVVFFVFMTFMFFIVPKL